MIVTKKELRNQIFIAQNKRNSIRKFAQTKNGK